MILKIFCLCIWQQMLYTKCPPTDQISFNLAVAKLNYQFGNICAI